METTINNYQFIWAGLFYFVMRALSSLQAPLLLFMNKHLNFKGEIVDTLLEVPTLSIMCIY